MRLNDSLKKFAILSLSVFTLAACSSSKTTSTDPSLTEPNIDSNQVIEPVDTKPAMTEQELKNEALRQSQTVYFNFDDTGINQEFAEMLGAHAAYLLANEDVNVTVEGHADERGTPEYNIALGERRANAVAKYLEVLGVPSSQISVVSFGEEKPLQFGHTEEDYKMNRRAILAY